MARSPRSDPDGGWHHVMNRGAGRRTVFHRARDARHFLGLLADGCRTADVEAHAYCLMGNHFHLLVRCPSGGLSDVMQRLGSTYTKYLNQRVGSDGPIFRGRFHSVLVDSDEYLVCAARYIHRNPVDRRPLVALDRYPWSSYGAYVGTSSPPAWLTTGVLLARHGGADGMRAFVEARDAEVMVPIDWAIETTLAEWQPELAATPHIRRTIAVGMLDRAAPALRDSVARSLAFPSPDARRRAINRWRDRVAADPRLDELVAMALRTAA